MHTGKSQTIANIISAAIGRRKKARFHPYW
jgi:hypothetical protein